jgi:hypothetical protein
MAKRRHSVRRHKRVKTRNITRASFKRGGDNTTDTSDTSVKPYVPFYNTKTGKQTIENAQFFDPTKINETQKTARNTAQKFPGIFQKSDPRDVAEVFKNPPLNRAAAIDDFNRLTEQYKNAIGGLKRRKTFKRKVSRRKSRRSK